MSAAASSRHRIFGFFRAPETAAGFILAVFILFFWIWSRLSGEPATALPAGPIVVSARIIEEDGGFALDLKADRPVFVALFLAPANEPPSLLFPRLGPPHGLPWPLDAGQEHRLPGAAELFRRPLAATDRVVVVARSDRVAGSMTDLPDDAMLGIVLDATRTPR